MYGTSVCMHSQHGCGAVIVAPRKTGAVNLVVSRESGGAVRAPGNAGDKRVKRKRGSRSAAAVAARIQRGYLKRIRTAGSTARVNNHVDSRGSGADGSGHPAAERTSTTARDGDDDTRVRKRKARTASAEHVEHAKTARAGRSGRHTGDRKARPVRRRSDEVHGLVVQIEEELTKTEASSTPRLNANQFQPEETKDDERINKDFWAHAEARKGFYRHHIEPTSSIARAEKRIISYSTKQY